MRSAVVVGLFLLSACLDTGPETSSDAVNADPRDALMTVEATAHGTPPSTAVSPTGASGHHDASVGAQVPSNQASPPSPDAGAATLPWGLSYYRDVKPIIDAKCTQCHFSGGMAPFPLTTFDEVKPFASGIRAAVSTGAMPPWRAAGPLDKYVGDRRLTEAQKSLIVSWVDQGAPSGEQSEEPPHATAEKRGLPRVDTVLQIPEPYTPQAEPDNYRCFVLDWPYQETRYITGLNVEADRAEMVHHAVVYAVDGLDALNARARDLLADGPGYDCVGTDVADGAWLTSYEPGGAGVANPDGVGFQIEPGSVLILQMHYNTSHGKGPDASRLQLMVEQTVSRVAQVSLLYNPLWVFGGMPIPAGRSDVVHRWQGRPNQFSSFFSYDLLAVDLHMHTLGKAGSIGIRRAASFTIEPLLEIPEWSFAWQETYRLQQPVRLYPGDELYVECHYDNTAEHLANAGHGASSAVRDVNWGDRSTDEMCLGNVLGVIAQD